MKRRVFRASIRYLSRVQGKDGGFASATAPRKDVPLAPAETSTVFAPSLIACCLATYAQAASKEEHLGEADEKAMKELRRIMRSVGRFIKKERGSTGLWGYFCEASKARRDPYPYDLDDTSSALIASQAIDAKGVDGDDLARLVDALTVCEDRIGGPYHTWIFDGVASSRWKGIDVAVNANVGSLLALHDIHIPSIANLIDRAVASRSIETKYYDALPSAYFLARYCAVRRDKASDAAKRTAKRLKKLVLAIRTGDGTWGDSMSDTLAVSTLARLGADADDMRKAVAALEASMQKDGSWPAAALYREERSEGSMAYAGSSALSTAFALEAIALFNRSVEDGINRKISMAREAVSARSMGVVRTHIRAMPPTLRTHATRILRSIQEKGLDALILPLPRMFRDATEGRLGSDTEETCVALGAANMLGWMGYMAQDDILDRDADASLLPVSNALLRRSMHLLRTEAPHDKAKDFVHRAFDLMDDANAREISGDAKAHSDVRIIGEKSFGHALGPMMLALRAGIAPTSTRFDALRRFFMHYLIARQMNDDAHDWEEDLGKGRQNWVCAKLMGAHRRKTGIRNPTRSSLKSFFWEYQIDRVSADIAFHANKARESWKKARLGDRAFADNLLAPIEIAADKAVRERDRASEFLAARRRRKAFIKPRDRALP